MKELNPAAAVELERLAAMFVHKVEAGALERGLPVVRALRMALDGEEMRGTVIKSDPAFTHYVRATQAALRSRLLELDMPAASA